VKFHVYKYMGDVEVEQIRALPRDALDEVKEPGFFFIIPANAMAITWGELFQIEKWSPEGADIEIGVFPSDPID
jgi:hypothetical protein